MSALQELAVDIEAERTGEAEGSTGATAFRGLRSWFGQLTVAQKITTFFSVMLAVALTAGLVMIAGLVQVSNQAQAIDETHDYAIGAERIVVALGNAQRHSELLLIDGEAERREGAQRALGDAQAAITRLEEEVRQSVPEVVGELAVLKQTTADFRRQIANFDTTTGNSSRRRAQALEIEATGAAARSEGTEIAAILGENADRTSQSGATLLSTLVTVWIVMVGVLVALTLFVLRFFNRNVGGALSEMAAQMTRLSEGNRDLSISGKDRRDEIGTMARALDVFHRASSRLARLSAERSKKTEEERERQAQLEAEREEARAEREAMLRDLANQFERTVGDVVNGVASASSQLQTTSKLMATTAEDTSRRTGEVASSMREANSGATAAAAASDEFAMSIGEISRQAASSAELARHATLSANKADETISALSDSAQQVGQIVELIQTIAQRTNLLALNASIEAARGGEAGRGFAVVASEVKELAMQTSRATEQVAEQIRAMQDTTGASVVALKAISDQVEQLETTAVSIASAVDQQSVAGQDLARSIDLAARGTEQVSTHIEDVRELSLSTGSAATQVLSSATDLEQQASTLRGQADSFLAKVRSG